jgi:two-component system OmpR family response regulator
MPPHSLNRVMYVEDEPDIRAIAKLALEVVGGFTVELCGSGQEALEKAPTFRPDLILLDVMMPGMDGPSTMEALRQQNDTASLPIAFMTAKVQSTEVQRYTDMGAIGVIAKPFDPMQLANMVKRLWMEHYGQS